MNGIIPLTEEAVKAYLDEAITFWRRLRGRGPGRARAENYVRALEGVRTDLFGEEPEDIHSDF